MIRHVTLLAGVLSLTACSSNPFGAVNSTLASRQEVTENYYIFDVKADLSDQEKVFTALSRGARRNAPNISIQRPLAMGPVPETPERFTLSDPLSNTAFGALATFGGAAVSFKVPECDGARLIATASKSLRHQDLRLNVCMFPYEGGYGMNVFTASTDKREGGALTLISDGTTKIIGDGEVWEEITVDGMLIEMAKLEGVEIALTESSKPLRDW